MSSNAQSLSMNTYLARFAQTSNSRGERKQAGLLAIENGNDVGNDSPAQ